MWKLEYCTDRHVLHEGTAETVKEAGEWTRKVEAENNHKYTDLDERGYVDEPDFKQWGTGYFWFCMVRV